MLSDGNPLLVCQIKLWRDDIKPSLTKALKRAPEDNLDWAPAENMINLGNIFLHISECSDWWYDEVMNKQKARELVPSARSATLSKADIANYMEAHWERMERFFSSDPKVLTKSYQYSGRTRTHTFTGFWIFSHLLEHDIHHRSQINQYLRILGVKPPEI
ncbi:MAG: hypothetical protein A2W25_01645 [candidate division Zixibacteria bacterium RBG_16_53_22]|nr:MAG: hypothetical protein A2W25_01645 [candidate division Zixibacteria bacterium RBG_16_53_22]